MTTNNFPALRQALEAGDLKHTQILELLDTAEQQAAEIASLEERVELALAWTRSHYNGKQRAEQALARNVAQAIRGCAKIARKWPKQYLRDFYPGKEKPTKDQARLANLVASSIATRIEQELEG